MNRKKVTEGYGCQKYPVIDCVQSSGPAKNCGEMNKSSSMATFPLQFPAQESLLCRYRRVRIQMIKGIPPLMHHRSSRVLGNNKWWKISLPSLFVPLLFLGPPSFGQNGADREYYRHQETYNNNNNKSIAEMVEEPCSQHGEREKRGGAHKICAPESWSRVLGFRSRRTADTQRARENVSERERRVAS